MGNRRDYLMAKSHFFLPLSAIRKEKEKVQYIKTNQAVVTSTGQGEWPITFSATLPMRSLLKPVLP
jgi:hypothetical protein